MSTNDANVAQATSAADSKTPLLFTPIKLRSVVVRNRIMAAPMCQ